MSDNRPATKQDVQELLALIKSIPKSTGWADDELGGCIDDNFDKVKNRLTAMFLDFEVRLLKKMNAKFCKTEEELLEKIKAHFGDKFEELFVHTGAMIEHAEERFLATGHDKISMHDDKLENHEGRIVRVEAAVDV